MEKLNSSTVAPAVCNWVLDSWSTFHLIHFFGKTISIMARVIILLSVILFSVYMTEQAHFLEKDYIDSINSVATTWKVSYWIVNLYNLNFIFWVIYPINNCALMSYFMLKLIISLEHKYRKVNKFYFYVSKLSI